MSGRINIPTLGAHPTAGPPTGRVFIYVLSTDNKSYFMLNDGIPRTFGVDAHSGLTLDDGTNPHNTTKSDVGLGNVPNVDATQRANHTGTQLAATISDFDNAVETYLDRAFEQDNVEQVNTTTTPADRHNFNVNPQHTANYLVLAVYTWAYDDNTTNFNGELSVGGTIRRRHEQEPQDSGGTDGGAGTDQRHSYTMAYLYSATQGVPFNVLLQFFAQSGGVEATIRDSLILVVRF